MALTLFSRMEGDTLDGTHDFTVGDNEWLRSSDAVFNNAAALVYGTNGLDCPGFNDAATLVISGGDLFDRNVGSFACIFRIPDLASGQSIITIHGTNNQDYLRLRISGTTEVGFETKKSDDSVEMVLTSGLSFAANTIYIAVCRWDITAPSRKIEVYNSSATLLQEATSTAAWTTKQPIDLTTINMGDIGGGYGPPGSAQFKNLFVSKVYAEPLEDNLLIQSYTAYGGGGAKGRGLLLGIG